MFLYGRRQFVEIKDRHSDLIDVKSGVPQVTVLGPLFFLIFINDILSNLTVKGRLFADDCILYTEVREPTDQINLNTCLARVGEWCNTWQMSLNLDKTVCMTITHKSKPIEFAYAIEGYPLARVSSYKYLGVIISHDLRWSTHIDSIVKKANYKLWYLRRSLKLSSMNTNLLAYKTLIRPLMEYACEIWDPHNVNDVLKLEKVQRLALRFIFSKYRRLNSPTALYSKANIPLLKVRRKEKRLKFLYMIINGLLQIDKTAYLVPDESRITRNKHSRALHQPRFFKDCFKYSFFPQTISDWNLLSEQAVVCQSLEAFSSYIASCEM